MIEKKIKQKKKKENDMNCDFNEHSDDNYIIVWDEDNK